MSNVGGELSGVEFKPPGDWKATLNSCLSRYNRSRRVGYSEYHLWPPNYMKSCYHFSIPSFRHVTWGGSHVGISLLPVANGKVGGKSALTVFLKCFLLGFMTVAAIVQLFVLTSAALSKRHLWYHRMRQLTRERVLPVCRSVLSFPQTALPTLCIDK